MNDNNNQNNNNPTGAYMPLSKKLQALQSNSVHNSGESQTDNNILFFYKDLQFDSSLQFTSSFRINKEAKKTNNNNNKSSILTLKSQRDSATKTAGLLTAKLWDTPVFVIKIEGHNLPKKELNEELENLKQLRHPNLLLYIGSCQPPLCIVTEFQNLGTLSFLLHKAKYKHAIILPKHLFNACICVAQGLQYLHSIGHVVEDLSSDKIWIGDDWKEIKILHLPLSFLEPEPKPSRSKENPYQWVAPELKDVQTKEANVYAFGTMLFEIFTRQDPWDPSSWSRKTTKKARQLVDPRPSKGTNSKSEKDNNDKAKDKSDKAKDKNDKTKDKNDKTKDKNDKTKDKSDKTKDKSDKTKDKNDKTKDKNDKTKDKSEKVNNTNDQKDQKQTKKDKTKPDLELPEIDPMALSAEPLLLPPLSKRSIPKFALKLITHCWRAQPADRPLAKDLYTIFAAQEEPHNGKKIVVCEKNLPKIKNFRSIFSDRLYLNLMPIRIFSGLIHNSEVADRKFHELLTTYEPTANLQFSVRTKLGTTFGVCCFPDRKSLIKSDHIFSPQKQKITKEITQFCAVDITRFDLQGALLTPKQSNINNDLEKFAGISVWGSTSDSATLFNWIKSNVFVDLSTNKYFRGILMALGPIERFFLLVFFRDASATDAFFKKEKLQTMFLKIKPFLTTNPKVEVFSSVHRISNNANPKN